MESGMKNETMTVKDGERKADTYRL